MAYCKLIIIISIEQIIGKLSKMKKYSSKALKIIPSGNLLYSKRPEMFLPNKWPTYFKKSKDCYVWDLKNKKYLDMIFAVGTNVLGYNYKKLDNKIKKTISNGNMTTLNSYEEVLLAQEILKINKWAGMVKFARSGGEANSISIRIARAYNKKKQNVAACGYHGWHDWYLSSNLSNKENLDYYISKNIKINGVNKKLKNTVFLFKYNDHKRLEYLLKYKKIGIIKMEVERNIKPQNNFLEKVRKLANKYKAVLIFDECTSGFRQTLGGIHKNYNVNPDIVTYGKAIGNGYAITAIVGKNKIMKACEDTFVSSTFWSERIGLVAALETIKIMKKEKTWKIIEEKGKYIKKKWKEIAKNHNLEIEIFGINSIPQFKFKKNNNILKTYVTDQMLKKNILANNTIYVSLAHKKKVLDLYFYELGKVFSKISKIKNIKSEIKVQEAHTEIKRLN